MHREIEVCTSHQRNGELLAEKACNQEKLSSLWGNESRQSLLYMVGLPSYICRATENFSLSKANKMNIYIYIYIYLTNRFQVAVRLFSNRSQMTSKCGKNKKVAHKAQPSASLMFLPHFDVLCDLLLSRCMATWNLFVLYNK